MSGTYKTSLMYFTLDKLSTATGPSRKKLCYQFVLLNLHLFEDIDRSQQLANITLDSPVESLTPVFMESDKSYKSRHQTQTSNASNTPLRHFFYFGPPLRHLLNTLFIIGWNSSSTKSYGSYSLLKNVSNTPFLIYSPWLIEIYVGLTTLEMSSPNRLWNHMI